MIDEEKTFDEKGYYSTDLKPRSAKKVWAVCERCGKGRWLRFYNYRNLCYSCAIKNRPIQKCKTPTEKRDYIDDEITYAEKGYRSTWLKQGSHLLVWTICANPDCEVEGGRGRWAEFRQCTDLCPSCASRTEECRRKIGDGNKGKLTGENNPNWKGGISLGKYCKFFNEPLKNAVRNYFDNICFECDKTIDKNGDRKMSVHHVNYQKSCGCDNTQFCIYVPLCSSCHPSTNHNRWYWYTKFMTELAIRNPNYYAYHIPVVYYDEPSYNYEYVFEKIRRRK